MAVQTETIDAITYSSTATSTSITLTDDYYAIMHSIKKLTEAINRLAEKI